MLVSGNFGVILETTDGNQWQRHQLPTQAAFMDITSCANGMVAALDTRHHVWVQMPQAADWQARPVTTREALMAITCDKDNQLWVTGSFTTLLRSETAGKDWQETTQDVDAQISDIQFIDDFGVASGEFGTMLYSVDKGKSWEMGEPLPNEFNPLALYFQDTQTGWVAGLGGSIFHTMDGGASWQRQQTETILPLYKIFEHDGHVYAVGDVGTLLLLDGQHWKTFDAGHNKAFYLIGGASIGDKLILVGGSGSVSVAKLEGLQ